MFFSTGFTGIFGQFIFKKLHENEKKFSTPVNPPIDNISCFFSTSTKKPFISKGTAESKFVVVAFLYCRVCEKTLLYYLVGEGGILNRLPKK